jgi:serine/threonine protein kinase
VIENSGEYKKPYNSKCDLFSFGIIAHMLLLGFNPVKGESYDDTFMRNKACEININKGLLAGKWGEHAYGFLNKLLAKYPQFRMDGEQASKH